MKTVKKNWFFRHLQIQKGSGADQTLRLSGSYTDIMLSGWECTCISGTALKYTDMFTCILSINLFEKNILWSRCVSLELPELPDPRHCSLNRAAYEDGTTNNFCEGKTKYSGSYGGLQYPRTSMGVEGRKKRDVSSSSKWNLVQSINVQPFPTSPLFQSTEFKVLADGWPTRCFKIVLIWKNEQIQQCSKALWEMKLGFFLPFI